MSTAPKKSRKDGGRESKTQEEKILEEDAVVTFQAFNLQRYINQYEGVTRIRRLMWVASHTVGDLQVQAYKQAIDEAKSDLNYPLYEECVSKAFEAISGKLDEKYLLDNGWVDTTRRAGHAEFTRLDAILTEAKRIGEREPIRVAYIQVANHQMRQGEFQKALSNYMDTKDHGKTTEHKMETCLNIIKAAIALRSFTHVKGQANRVQNIIATNTDWKSKVSASLGLCHLKSGNFQGAATQFLRCDVSLGKSYNHIISLKDIAIYGSFCALASFNRQNLRRIIESDNWKKFLEFAPIWRKIILDYVNSSYAACFEKLERQKNNMILDQYVSSHFHQLEKRIRDRSFQQYFRAYKSVKIPTLARAFNMEVPAVERYLISLISENKLQARIDSHNKILFSRVADQRSVTYQESLDLGNGYVRYVKSLLMRMSLIKAEFIIRRPHRGGKHAFSSGLVDDEKKSRQDDCT